MEEYDSRVRRGEPTPGRQGRSLLDLTHAEPRNVGKSRKQGAVRPRGVSAFDLCVPSHAVKGRLLPGDPPRG